MTVVLITCNCSSFGIIIIKFDSMAKYDSSNGFDIGSILSNYLKLIKLQFLGWQRCLNMSTAYFLKWIKIFILFYLWVLLCSKVGDNHDFLFLSGTAIDRVLNPVQIGPILAKICKKVLSTIMQKLLHKALRLVLVKC